MLVSYAHSHGVLLIRSKQTGGHSEEIYLVIKDVRAMEARMWFDGIAIDEVDQLYLAGFRSQPSAMVEFGNKIYALLGRDWEGFIVGGAMYFADSGDEVKALLSD